MKLSQQKDHIFNTQLLELNKVVDYHPKTEIFKNNLHLLETTQLQKSIQEAPIINCGEYKFAKYNFGEEGSYLTPGLISEIKQGLVHLYNDLDVDADYIVSTEPGAHLWGLLVAEKLDKPLNIIRTRNLRIPQNEKLYEQRTGYVARNLCFDNFNPGDKIVILEDIISTGATIKLIIDTLQKLSVEVLGVIGILRKGIDHLDSEAHIPIKSIL